MAKVRLLRPLDGKEVGFTTDYPDLDAKRLAENGVVEILDAKVAPKPSNKMMTDPPNKAVFARGRKGN